MTQKIHFNNLTGNSITIGNTVIDGTGITTDGETVAGIKADIYANNASLPLSGLTAGKYAYTTANTTLFYTDGNGWYKVTTINETPSVTLSVDSVTLGLDGNTADFTYTITDESAVTITVSNSGIANTSLANVQHYTSNNTITVNNVGFSENDTVTVTVSASDGVNIGTATANVIINLTPPVPAVSATGGSTGTFTEGGHTYKYHKFTTGGTFTVSSADNNAVFDMLVVAGGGGGGRGATTGGVGEVAGGGGAGGLVYVSEKPLNSGSYSITVGSAGLGYNSDSASGDGGDSTAMSYTATGGGGGAYRTTTAYAGRDGGSGGGAHRTGVAGTSTQDTYSSDPYATGYGNDSGGGVSATASIASGGGAGGAGTSSTYSTIGTVAAGGAGRTYNMDGTSKTYSRGGDSVADSSGGTSNAGVFGGGGRGYRETNAGENGQAGIVIIRYKVAS